MNDRLMLVDCDGVLLDYDAGFETFMNAKGYTRRRDIKTYALEVIYGITKQEKHDFIREYNESEEILDMPTLRDARLGLLNLNDDYGFRFKVVTSFSDNPKAIQRRCDVLEEHFGDVFEDIVSIGQGADKDEALAPHKDSGLIWVEDKVENALLGANLGLDAVLMEHEHSEDFTHPEITKARMWFDVFMHATKDIERI